MKPGVKQARSLCWPPTASLIPRRGEQDITNEPSHHNSFQPLEMQQALNHFTQEYQVPIVDELHKRLHNTPQSLPSFTTYNVSRNNSSSIEASNRQQNEK